MSWRIDEIPLAITASEAGALIAIALTPPLRTEVIGVSVHHESTTKNVYLVKGTGTAPNGLIVPMNPAGSNPGTVFILDARAGDVYKLRTAAGDGNVACSVTIGHWTGGNEQFNATDYAATFASQLATIDTVVDGIASALATVDGLVDGLTTNLGIANGKLDDLQDDLDDVHAATTPLNVAQVDNILVAVVAAFPHTYSYKVGDTTVSYVMAELDAEANIRAGLVIAHNLAVAGVTAQSGAGNSLDVTADVPGVGFTVSAVDANLTLSHTTPNANLASRLAGIEAKIDVIDGLVDTIVANTSPTRAGVPQTPTWANATLSTETSTTTIMNCATQSVDLLSANLELVAAAHASTTSFRLEHRRGATVIRTLILDAQAPGTYFTAAGLNVAWEDAAEPFAVGDLLVLVATGVAGGTNSVKVRTRIAARVDGGTMTVTP